MNSALSDRIFLEAKARFPIYLIAIFFVWPCVSIVIAVRDIPYDSLSLGQAILFSAGGMMALLPDAVFIGTICLVICLALFTLLASLGFTVKTDYRIGLIVEPFTLFLAAWFGASLYYPSVLSFPRLSIFGMLPAWALISILACLLIIWGVLLSTPGHRICVVTIILIFTILIPFPAIYRNQIKPSLPATPPVVLLGIDSLSHSDDLLQIKHWIRAKGGAWYTHAVSPGLLTNAVWTSIILSKPVHEHGVFHTFQSKPAIFSSDSLIDKAHEQGYYTVSVFPDQFTCWPGSEYNFDLNLSGPIGWRQLAVTIFENSSILLPLFRPILPRLPFSSVPPNHAGAYTYSIEREFNEILSQSSAKSATLVIGHSTYLHVPIYPKYSDLSWIEIKRVLRSPVNRITDRCFDWQDVDHPDDPIPLRQWKVRHVQTAITETIDRLRFLERGGKLILFSDHGNRIDLCSTNFNEDRYFHVMFASFGLPVRDLNTPISTMESASILGLVQNEHFDPVVEFAIGEPFEWEALAQSTKLDYSGRVHLNDELLSAIYKRLRSHRPWGKGEN